MDAHIAQKSPYATPVEAGKDYYWCACGLSKAPPFCDGPQQAAGEFAPVKFAAEVTAAVHFCGGKATRNQPLFYGSHRNAP